MNGEPIRLTRAQVREVDRLAIEEYHIPGIILMEHAAQAVTAAAIHMLQWQDSATVLVVCGGGNNGGDGFAVAHQLKNGLVDELPEITIAMTVDAEKLTGDALTNWRIAKAMGIPMIAATPAALRDTFRELTIDAIFGTGLTRPPRDPFAEIVAALNGDTHPVIAVDVPSGLDCDTGEPLGGSCIRATRTVTFVAPKAGFNNPAASQYLGEVTVGDIGCPHELVARVIAGHAGGR